VINLLRSGGQKIPLFSNSALPLQPARGRGAARGGVGGRGNWSIVLHSSKETYSSADSDPIPS
jgi:hypothetical protein